jgi:hypothetical protein
VHPEGIRCPVVLSVDPVAVRPVITIHDDGRAEGLKMMNEIEHISAIPLECATNLGHSRDIGVLILQRAIGRIGARFHEFHREGRSGVRHERSIGGWNCRNRVFDTENNCHLRSIGGFLTPK